MRDGGRRERELRRVATQGDAAPRGGHVDGELSDDDLSEVAGGLARTPTGRWAEMAALDLIDTLGPVRRSSLGG